MKSLELLEGGQSDMFFYPSSWTANLSTAHNSVPDAEGSSLRVSSTSTYFQSSSSQTRLEFVQIMAGVSSLRV